MQKKRERKPLAGGNGNSSMIKLAAAIFKVEKNFSSLPVGNFLEELTRMKSFIYHSVPEKLLLLLPFPFLQFMDHSLQSILTIRESKTPEPGLEECATIKWEI